MARAACDEDADFSSEGVATEWDRDKRALLGEALDKICPDDSYPGQKELLSHVIGTLLELRLV